jgi:hypothetical protein
MTATGVTREIGNDLVDPLGPGDVGNVWKRHLRPHASTADTMKHAVAVAATKVVT